MRLKKKLVVVGNGMAGMKTVETLLSIEPDLYDVTVIGKEHYPNYNRIMLSPVLSGEKIFDEIILHDEQWCRDRGIHLVMGDAVIAIDRKKQVVQTASGKTFFYDRLLLATGSNPLILPIQGIDHPEVMTFRDVSDVMRLRACAEGSPRVAVIGGGLLGLEAAYGLSRQGASVSVIHNMPFLMNRQLDETAGNLLKKELEKRGVSTTLDLERLVSLIKERAHFVNELWDLADYFFVAPTSYDEKAAKNWKESCFALLRT